jgi:hypothetical protein
MVSGTSSPKATLPSAPEPRWRRCWSTVDPSRMRSAASTGPGRSTPRASRPRSAPRCPLAITAHLGSTDRGSDGLASDSEPATAGILPRGSRPAPADMGRDLRNWQTGCIGPLSVSRSGGNRNGPKPWLGPHLSELHPDPQPESPHEGASARSDGQVLRPLLRLRAMRHDDARSEKTTAGVDRTAVDGPDSRSPPA